MVNRVEFESCLEETRLKRTVDEGPYLITKRAKLANEPDGELEEELDAEYGVLGGKSRDIKQNRTEEGSGKVCARSHLKCLGFVVLDAKLNDELCFHCVTVLFLETLWSSLFYSPMPFLRLL